MVVTGGSGGLGLACARALSAVPGVRLVVTGRHRERLAAAAAELGALPLSLDLGSLAEVRRVADQLAAAALPPLRGLVCNAGQQFARDTTTADGYEATFGVNHLGHLALVEALVDRFAPPARIVFVASGTHDPAKLTLMPHPTERAGAAELAHPAASLEPSGRAGRRRYATSKLANVRTAYLLADRLGERGITVNAFDPGLMPGTGLADDMPAAARLVWRTVAKLLLPLPGVNTPRTSGADLAHLVTAPELAGVTGAYFVRRSPAGSSLASHDAEAANMLYRDSLGLIRAVTG